MNSIASILATCTDAPALVADTTEWPTVTATDGKIQNLNPTEIYANRAITPDSRIESDDESVKPSQDKSTEEKVTAKVDVPVVHEESQNWRSQVGSI